MKLYSLGLIALLTYSSSLKATKTDEDMLDKAPKIIPWHVLKYKLDADRDWQEIKINDVKWHFHWHHTPTTPIEDAYPPETHVISALWVSDSRSNSSKITGAFAAYQLGGAKKDAKELVYKPFGIYTFYLSVPHTCNIQDHKH